MIYLSGKGIVHRDLAARNCLLGAPTSESHGVPVLKLADFGMSRVIGRDATKIVDHPFPAGKKLNAYVTRGSLSSASGFDPNASMQRSASTESVFRMLPESAAAGDLAPGGTDLKRTKSTNSLYGGM
ncbi:hypothetical protein SARC_04844 [Sphaeroforma arctica JP610]|uniref:Protein kinase domain-containing protein n=1 Tax=Sphaeroforma arctica JP610 TaxID=667725 RepID=A0A0L0G213_9EUKA|nr:hypothetical protein SARC_04844 [Sphaeroforma arctica JP610]KNC82879.1 hypothetical protein SARC_04844 [Sphaeroforma arctica JP610]|eukprot:XP_014156781.1 hypothetical protein SARC_04844 [Sphaeroforma arctica JP610]